MKPKIGWAVFWLLIGLVVLLAFVIANAVMTVVDDCLAWIERKINARFDVLTRDIW